ncbi:lipopolysaccharide biosynthesis protein [Collinsella intestinalis]|uniref:lipopolysaccharide biosynthesis protein n=1 Tax=Collinsella intestinalis TaxID=147207 RepID=UPI0019570C8F|nr:polysaccharide biosynthesis C-terminal domain-containing protein [Collinsella intestinalis]MBM6682559.1 polysaccharide biosynthesis C-terminal domain-containing protein [Collinsella intestinalis]
MTRGYGYFAKNVGLLTISNFGSKLLSFLLVPLYTNVLTTEQYGTYDILYTTASLLIPVLTVNINEGVLRFCLDRDANRRDVLSVSVRVFLPGAVLLAALVAANHWLRLIPLLDEYAMPFVFLYVASALNGILVMYARGADMVADVAVSGIVCSAVVLGLSVLLLVLFPLGLEGYFIANIAGLGAQCAYIVIRQRLWRQLSLKPLSRGERTLLKRMTAYTAPMIANSISWWVTNAAGKYAVIILCGSAMNGIYSASYKIPSILSVFQSIVYSAWVLSAVQDFDKDDESGFFSDTYSLYGFAMCALCSMVMIANRPLAGILYGSAFYEAWVYVPPLLISIVFLALASFLGGVFSAVRDSKAYAKSSAVTAVCNAILSMALVWRFGVMGASVAAAISYGVMLVLRLKDARRYIRLRLHLVRDSAAYAVLAAQAALLVIPGVDGLIRYALQAVCLIAIAALYRREGARVFKSVVGRIQRGGSRA